MPVSKTHLPSVVVLVVAGCGFFLSLGLAAALAAAGLIFRFVGPQGEEVAFTAISFAWENVLVALLVLPAALLGLYRLLEKPFNLPGLPRWTKAPAAIILWPAVLGAGYLLAESAHLALWFLPPLQILAIAIPIWWLVSSISRGLDVGPAASRWKIFAMCLVAGNPLIFFLELLIVLPLAFLWIYGQPDFITLVSGMAGGLTAPASDPEALKLIVKALIAYPGLVPALIVGACILAPLLEEILKTAGVWLLFKKYLTPARGLAAGAVCGAAFALVESLGVINQPLAGQAWLAMVVGRLGTAVMHIFAASLSGWGIASLASHKKFGRTLSGYAAAIFLHGLWNFLVIITAIHPYLDASSPQNGFYQLLGGIGIQVTAGLAVVYFGLIFLVNRALRPPVPRAAVYEVK